MTNPGERYEGPMGPVIASIFAVIGWLVFILLYALYWSEGFNLFQNIIVTVVSLAIMGMLIGAMWLIWYHPTGELRRQPKEMPAQ
ncbi:MAG: hypothetical protein M1368_03300 [Thaumarchaeota archaeon]|nr:hypothetical protein [Nitrososphaerota archaeon]